ncbi:MAG: hypothetical protein SVM80_04740 [Halobacteriota archaeon]|nr:hypothetical protein [Halobacteriota archaeon]
MVKTPERLFECFCSGNESKESYSMKRAKKCTNCGGKNLLREYDYYGRM